MKDPDLGIFPMTTSSHTLAGYGCVGAPVPPTAVRDVICVTKAYSSSVGSNTEPFVSELTGPEGDELRRRGGDKGEFGATTGRPRRVGGFDVVASRYGVMVQGATEIALTKLDVLSGMEKVPVCVAYEVDGKRVEDFPTGARLDRAKPVYEYLPGFGDVSKCRKKEDLPQTALDYIAYLEKAVNCPIKYVSVGAERDAYIEMF